LLSGRFLGVLKPSFRFLSASCLAVRRGEKKARCERALSEWLRSNLV
jgi:hypothetical protein